MTRVNSGLPDQNAINETFDREAGRYDRHAVLEREVGSRLMERLEFQRNVPGRIIDLGSGTGSCCVALKRRFPDAEIIGLDASLGMSRELQRQSGIPFPLTPVCGDLLQPPFAARSADILFSNLAVQWSSDFRAVIDGWRRILRPGGLLLFSNLGPDSLKELKLAASYGQTFTRARHFIDMHDMGDALVAAGFCEPVMDSEYITTEYRRFDDLLIELEATGVNTHFDDWAGRIHSASSLAKAYENFRRNDRYPVTWEIVYGAAFGPEEGQPIRTGEGDVAAFSVDFLRGSARRR